MKIKAIHNIRHSGVRYVKGSIVDLPAAQAERLVRKGAAESLEVEAPPSAIQTATPTVTPSKPATTKTSTPRQCAYVKRNGTRCTREAEPGKEYCHICKLTVAKMAKRAAKDKAEGKAPETKPVTVPPGIDPSLIPDGE